MKFKLIAIIFALATTSWAQSANSSNPNPTQPATAAIQTATKADCRKKMADSKATESCRAHCQNGSAESEMACCKDKDATSCMKGDKDKSACLNGKCSSSDGKAECCSKSGKTAEQAAMACCGANGDRCGTAHPDHGEMN